MAKPRESRPSRTVWVKCVAPLAALAAGQLVAGEIHVSTAGRDGNPGTVREPVATPAAAQKLARQQAGRGPVRVILHGGTYYLPETLRFTAEDSGTAAAPVSYEAAPGEEVFLSGGMRLKLDWAPLSNGVSQARTPPGLVIDQLFVNGTRQHMARYPNYDPTARQFNGAAPDAIAPARVARWADPAGGFIHAMHAALWGDMHWRILGKKADGSLNYEGGWQNNRSSPMHEQFRFVENIREELDAPGEWFHDVRESMLYFLPQADLDLKRASIEAVRLRHLVEFAGTRERPVRFLAFRGLRFRHAARTFMENREPLLRSDWTTYRGGAVTCEGAEDIRIEDCDFDQVGGNGIFVTRYNRRITIRGCLLRESGANGVAFVGSSKAVRSPLFNYNERFDYDQLDRTPGPVGDDYPADCLIEDCLVTRSGRFEKQTAPVQISMARRITVRNCSIYDVPRAGINIGDGCWGGHLVEGCDIFDTVLETGDHGSFNSWGRDRYWHPDVRTVDKQVLADPTLPFLDMVEPTVLRGNRWRCDHGWDIDLDDGSSRYVIHNNVLLNGGLKMREGYARVATNNIILNNSLHPHVWFNNSQDVFARNIVMGPYFPAIMDVARWGREIDWNLFATSEADRTKFAANGCDAHSLVGDPQFIDPGQGDFRVAPGSPALRLGFVSFPTDQFGVRSPRLRSVSRSPAIPRLKIVASGRGGPLTAQANWKGATLRALAGEEYSAIGVARDAAGVLVAESPAGSEAHTLGLRKGDLVQTVNGKAVAGPEAFVESMRAATGTGTRRLGIVRNQKPATLEIPATAGVPAEPLRR